MDRRARPSTLVVVVAFTTVMAGCLGGVAPPATTTPPDSEATSTLSAGGEMLSPDAGTVATVVRIVDGDTVVVELTDGTEEKIRLVGVDTPEVHVETTPDEFGVPDTEAGRSCLRRWGERASEYAKRHLDGRTVRLVFDEGLPRRGYYGRLLAYVYVDGVSFNHALIETGHARVFRSDFTRRPAYETTQRRVRANRTGLWECLGTGGTTVETPQSGSGLVVANVVADAPGNDNDDPNGEYVVFENAGETTLNLTGWTVSDAAGHEFRFPAGTVLAPGERITLYTGSGTDTGTELYWGLSGAVWDNGGDTVVVVDDEGTTVFRESY